MDNKQENIDSLEKGIRQLELWIEDLELKIEKCKDVIKDHEKLIDRIKGDE